MSHNDAPELPSAAHWTPSVWRSFPPVQQPEWPDEGELDAIVKNLGEWPPLVFTTTAEGVAVNLYTAAAGKAQTAAGAIALTMKTGYPRTGEVRIAVTPDAPQSFPLLIRIPAWAMGASVNVNGKPAEGTPHAGEYFRILRAWRKGDEVALTFPMKIRVERKSAVAMRLIHTVETGKPLIDRSGATSTMRRTRLVSVGEASSAISDPVEWASM